VESRLKNLGVEFLKNEPLSNYTTIGIGGPCSFLVFPKKLEEFLNILEECNSIGMEFYLLGGGSNLLVSDQGFDGVIITLKGLNEVELVDEDDSSVKIKVGAGTRIAKILNFQVRHGLEGLEFLAGVPATVGGCVKMNAGAFGKEIKDFVERIWLIKDGVVNEVVPKEEDWDYRKFKQEGAIFEVELKFLKSSVEKVKNNIKEVVESRRAKQPILKKTFGCAFKNPSGDFAGRLIERAGLKGFRIGDARISPIHANFIENLENATAKQVIELMKVVIDKVYKNFETILEPEVKFLGCGL